MGQQMLSAAMQYTVNVGGMTKDNFTKFQVRIVRMN
jgi:hypothetical protein